jgi:hypothetical protein
LLPLQLIFITNSLAPPSAELVQGDGGGTTTRLGLQRFDHLPTMIVSSSSPLPPGRLAEGLAAAAAGGEGLAIRSMLCLQMN